MRTPEQFMCGITQPGHEITAARGGMVACSKCGLMEPWAYEEQDKEAENRLMLKLVTDLVKEQAATIKRLESACEDKSK